MKEKIGLRDKGKRQAEKDIVRKFYKDFFTWKADKVGMWVAAGLAEFVYVCLLIIPFEEMKGEKTVIAIMLLLGVVASYMYLVPYLTFTEEGKRCRIYQKIKYLPVDKSIIQQVRVEQLLKFVLKLFPIIAVLQLGMSLIVEHRLSGWNIAYVLWFGLLWPFITNLPTAWIEKA